MILNYNNSILKNKNRVIIANGNTGKWIKISEQCWNIVQYGIDNKLKSEEIIGLM